MPSYIPLSEILPYYQKRENVPTCYSGFFLSDGTRIYPTQDGSGIRVFRPLEHPNYREETGYYPFK